MYFFNTKINKKVRGGGLNGKVKFFSISKYKILLSLFFVLGVCFCFGKITFAYPPYTPNSDLVVVGPYDTAPTSGVKNIGDGVGDGVAKRYWLNGGQKYRIRQNGTISKAKVWVPNSNGTFTFFQIQIWRPNGTNFDLVGESENFYSSITKNQVNEITLSSPISNVQEGDYYGIVISMNGDTGSMYARSGLTGVNLYYTSTTPSDTNYNWLANSKLSGYAIPLELYMQAPQGVFIGDSIVAGHPANYSFLETTATTDISSTIEKQFSNLTGYTYQNMGIGSQTTSNISARFTNDALNLKPRFIVVEGGVNDLAGSVDKSVFIANWTSMLDAVQADDDITTIIILKILPWTDGTNIQMQTRDDWNASLVTLSSGYSKAIVVDASTYVGQFRAGGDVGNLWDIQLAYDESGVHFNQAGNSQIAQAIADALDSDAPVTTALPLGGIYNSFKTVTLSCDDGSGQGCNKTYYTIDGTDPTTSSPEYTVPLDISSNTTLKFFSVDVVDNQESVKTEVYVIDTESPVTTATPAGGTYDSVQVVTLTTDEAATTYYTLDGTDPTILSLVYSLPITISETSVLKFFSVDNVGNSESVKTEEYIINTEAPFIPFIEKLNLENVILNQTYQSQQNNADLLFYLLPKQKVIKDLYIKLIRNKKKHLNGFTKKNSYPGYLKLLSNIGTVKKAYQKNVNKHINFRVSVRYSKTKLNKTNIKEKNLRLFIKDRDGIWRGPYRIYQNKTTHTLKFKIRNYLVRQPKNPVPNPLDVKTKNRPFAPSFYFRTLKKIKFVIAEKNTLSKLTNSETSDSQDFDFE
ncbi:MAG: chitobiase/beta-hexosaminidase C-terminal domain-containing protein [Patescibacteria group bacterium]